MYANMTTIMFMGNLYNLNYYTVDPPFALDEDPEVFLLSLEGYNSGGEISAS